MVFNYPRILTITVYLIAPKQPPMQPYGVMYPLSMENLFARRQIRVEINTKIQISWVLKFKLTVQFMSISRSYTLYNIKWKLTIDLMNISRNYTNKNSRFPNTYPTEFLTKLWEL